MHSHSLSQLECLNFKGHTQQLNTTEQYKLHKIENKSTKGREQIRQTHAIHKEKYERRVEKREVKSREEKHVVYKERSRE